MITVLSVRTDRLSCINIRFIIIMFTPLSKQALVGFTQSRSHIVSSGVSVRHVGHLLECFSGYA